MNAIILACIAIAYCHIPFTLPAHDPTTSALRVDELYFTQMLDHYDLANSKTFQQRYWISDTTYQTPGPLLVYICGESTGKFPADGTFFIKMAQEYKGIAVALEHRYYGMSQPTSDWSLDNLQYLSHDQALADLVYFIDYLKGTFKTKYGITGIQTIVVGGSYAGALSAWARYKYPHIIDAALSSSGVVNAIEDFYKFDEQIYISTLRSGASCTAHIQQLMKEVEKRMSQGVAAKYKLMSIFKAEYMEWDDFWFYFTDIFVEAVQYGGRVQLCELLATLTGDMDSQLAKIYEYTPNIRIEAASYAFRNIRKQDINISAQYRQWKYQFCSSLAYFNTPAKQNPMRWEGMDIYYWRRYCSKAFGETLYPDTFNVNAMYGDLRVATAASHIYFTNGGEDPWQWAGIKPNDKISTSNKMMLMSCENCGHCIDLHAALDNDAQIVKDTRNDILLTIGNWLSESSGSK